MYSLRLFLIFILTSIVLLLNLHGLIQASTDDLIATNLMLNAPSTAALGKPLRLESDLRDGPGQPIAQATITFYNPASFLAGASGLVRIGDATTNDQGIAVLEYAPRRNGENAFIAEYKGSSRYAPSQATIRLNVEGNEQLYESEAGLKVPYVSKWLLVGFLSAVWGTLFFVVGLILKIALARPE